MELEKIESLSDYVVFNGFRELGGPRLVFRFPNGYGASVVQGPGTYGMELAVIRFFSEDNDDFDLVYDTPITADVLGWLTEDDLVRTLKSIKAL